MATSQSLLTVWFYSFRHSILYTTVVLTCEVSHIICNVLQALPCKALWSKPITWHKTAMLESKRDTRWRKTKKLTILNGARLLFVLSQCVPYSTAWRFCTTWMTSCKETAGIPYVTPVCNGCISFGCDVVCIIHPHPKVVILYFYSSTCFIRQRSYLVAIKIILQIILKKN